MNSQDNNNLGDFKILSKYDDLFTDLFLDHMFLWFKTIKMNKDYRQARVPQAKILEIIKRHILENSRPLDAVKELLEIDYIKNYLSLKNPKQVQEFVQHMKRYLYMYMPNAGYEVCDTKRYTEKTVEACLIATKDWHAGDEMKLLTGVIATLDPKDDAELKQGNRDFSVMWSSRKNCTCLFLGPARFANHDCESNCRFIAHGLNSIIFKVTKEIKCGDEITVFYGQHYFGENNCECKCITCELNSKGSFAQPIQEAPVKLRTRPTRSRKPPMAHGDYVQTSNRLKRSASTDTQEQENLLKKKLRVMSIDYICNEKKEKEITLIVYPSQSPPLSTPSDSAVSLSPDKPESDVLEQFLNDLSDLSDVSSVASVEEPKVSKPQVVKEILKCVSCCRPLQNVTEQVGPDASLTQELATWSWSPSAVFSSWGRHQKCPRCERHFNIFNQEWPLRKEKKECKKSRKLKSKKTAQIHDPFKSKLLPQEEEL